ncbi:hypothetical protein CSC94_11150 [Zhengella mangrovi]|uniref:Uncharacterized protein n=1 Tax=Zhengella mangrovi TaxID=1982044 RepID=A0A2G1QNG9_9HYPH|nr:hypothetical protein [Zhengella mangrovi]PHP67097.1 hypothetical protein CSC94_11150 [Zhengella mangrovi]
MKLLILVAGLCLGASVAHADTRQSETPITRVSASVYLMGTPEKHESSSIAVMGAKESPSIFVMGTPAEPKAEPVRVAKAKPAVVASLPTADMSLDEIIGKRPELMNRPAALADFGIAPKSGEGRIYGPQEMATASAEPAPGQPESAIDTAKTAAVQPGMTPQPEPAKGDAPMNPDKPKQPDADLRGMVLRRE